MKKLNLHTCVDSTASRSIHKSVGNEPDLLQEVQRAVQACQRCIIITGAGISVSSGIPDFRSPDGLFRQLKQKYPSAVTNGKDLFDATLFSDPAMISVFYNFMGELRNLVSQANCTPTHRFIKELEENGKLLRCYTQNIDSLEKRIGLETSFQRPAVAAAEAAETAAVKANDSALDVVAECSSQISDTSSSIDTEHTVAADAQLDGQNADPAAQSQPRVKKPVTRRRRQTTLDKTFTRAVQLHGDLDNVVCTICHTRYPFTKQLALEFCEGAPPPCPRCKEIEVIRDLVGKRSVASGVLRPDIVLYNEAHPQSEVIGALSEYDLKRRPDLLIVIGTSLKIPGIKRMVKEMSRCVRDCSARAKRAGAGKAIFINRDEPPKGWDDVFDIYVCGDSDQVIGHLPIGSTECSAEPNTVAGDASDAGSTTEKTCCEDSGREDKCAVSPMAIANICDLDSAGTQDTENASLVTGKKKPAGRAQPRRRQLKKPDSAETSLARACRKPAGGLRKRTPPVSSLQRQPPRKLTSMLKVVKSGAVADSKRSKRIGASPQSPLAKLDIPTSPLIASPSPSL